MQTSLFEKPISNYVIKLRKTKSRKNQSIGSQNRSINFETERFKICFSFYPIDPYRGTDRSLFKWNGLPKKPIDHFSYPIDHFLNRKFKFQNQSIRYQNQSIYFQIECSRLQNRSITYKNWSIPFLSRNRNCLHPTKINRSPCIYCRL